MTAELLLKQEQAMLNNLYSAYDLERSPQSRTMQQLIAKTILPFLKADTNGLEFGCSDGYLTEQYARIIAQLDVVDASENFIREARKRALPNVNFFCSLFEEFETNTKYDYIFASFILEHVIDPLQILSIMKRLLKPDGLIFVIVPNARALSRQLALHMNIISDLKNLTENDLRYGHRRVYDRVAINKDLASLGFETIYQTGLMLKILADFQMDQLIGEQFLQQQHIEGLYTLGLEYPDLCGSLFSVARIKA
jgi:2-polyprenyl-3-methyl-5-hydroxy-6-metoxy-1,4-benzoquinol methylase